MIEFRQDPLTGRWVSIAEDRANRPSDFDGPPPAGGARACPFCEGNEQETPHEVLAVRAADSSADAPGWQVRVISNRFPAFAVDADACEGGEPDELCLRQAALGVHEVIVESPRHLQSVTQLADDEMRVVLRVYRQRLRQLRADGRWRYGLIFKNNGRAAGASLAHLHSQLVALPDLPPQVQQKLDLSRGFFDRHGHSVWSEIIRRERADGRRIVTETASLVAVCPFASRVPYEILILPKQPADRFWEIGDRQADELAVLMRDLVVRLEEVLPEPAFNWLINLSPFDSLDEGHYHWHVEIVPRVTRLAGYEWATGHAINPVSPERAAEALRSTGGSNLSPSAPGLKSCLAAGKSS